MRLINRCRGERYYIDEFDNDRFQRWHKARCQAHYRKETWELTVEDWFALWPLEKWQRRGRGTNDLCLVRNDYDLPWRLDNCSIISRGEQLRRKNYLKAAQNRRIKIINGK